MPMLTALTISIGALGGIATWLYLGPLAGLGLQIWATFIAWAAFYHSGGKVAALSTNIPAHIFGGLVGLIALIATLQLAGALGLPVAAGICVAIGAGLLVFAANLPALGSIPSSVYGFASTAAFALLVPGNTDLMTSASLSNPWVIVSVSLVLGALLGYLSEMLGSAMAAKTA